MSEQLDKIFEEWPHRLMIQGGKLRGYRGLVPRKRPPRETKLFINGRQVKPGDNPLKFLRQKPTPKIKRPVACLAAQEMFDEAAWIMKEREDG